MWDDIPSELELNVPNELDSSMSSFSDEAIDIIKKDILLQAANLCKLSYSDATQIPQEEFFLNLDKNITIVQDPTTDAYGIIVSNKDYKIVYIIIRGTDSLKDVCYDLDVAHSTAKIPNEHDYDIIFHDGFHKQSCSLIEQIKENPLILHSKQIICCGHSSGGAITSIIGFYLIEQKIHDNIQIITFATPVFTNKHGVKWFHQKVPNYSSVIQYDDIITEVPRKYILQKKCQQYKIMNKNIYYYKNKQFIINPKDISEDFNCAFRLVCIHYMLKHHHISSYIDVITEYY